MLEQHSSQTQVGTQEPTQLEGIRQKVFMDRYSLKDAAGQPLEFHPEDLWARIARGIAAVEPTEEQKALWEGRFYEALSNFQFVPGGRILAGAGSGHQVTFYNCYVVPSPEDSRQGILDNLKVMTEIMARGGGVGINLSTLRPRGSYIKTVNGTASGPCSWAQLYSVATGDVIQQGGCFGPDERIATDHGLLRAKELADRLEAGEKIRAKTHRGARPFTYVFRNGVKDLYEVKTHRGYRVRVTPDHKMAAIRHGEIVTIPLRELHEGDEVLLLLGNEERNNLQFAPLTTSPYKRSKMSTTLNEQVKLPSHLTPELAYFLGFLYGDGHVMQGKKVTWQDEKGVSLAVENTRPDIQQRLITLTKELFGLEAKVYPGDGACTSVVIFSRLLVEWLQENGLLKQKTAYVRVPEAIFRSPTPVVAAFIGGYFDADGCDRGKKGGYGFDSVSYEMLEDIQQLLLAQGIVSHIATQDRSAQGWLTIHRLLITGAQFRERFSNFIDCHKDQQRLGFRSHNSSYPMEVWDTLGIPGRYYQGLFDSTKERVSHYALTRVRERVAPSAGIGMLERLDALLNVLPDTITSITPVGTSDVYDFEVDDVHLLSGGGFYTSNSRRGALMLMLDDSHPDIEEFITVKRTAGKIEHANLSVCISDKFMEAVKNDADWNLIWQDKVMKTIRARQLWDLICTSAWESAEPGMVFMDRYNTESNTWYYENIRCVNPCVTGDTLIYTDNGLIPARELAERGTPVAIVSPDVIVKELATTGHAYSESKEYITIQSPDKRISVRQASHVFATGIKPVYRLQTKEGYTLRLTKDHKVLTDKGWKEAGELVAGNKVALLNGKGTSRTSENFELRMGSFERLTPDGEEMVYDLTEPEMHLFVANGVIVHNCGEQGLPPWGVCNLGAINLAAFVENGQMNYERLAQTSKVAMRFLDNVIDANLYFIEENREAQMGTRRTGLGTMGLADALIKMKIAYGSEASVPVIERIYSTIRDAAYDESADIAKEKGPFPNFDRDKYMQGKFIQRLPKAIQTKIKQQGIRNAVLLTQAPTGTTSLFAGVSSGIEPVYDFAMVRRDRTGEHILYHPLLEEWRNAHPNEPTPAYFVASNDLTPEEHVVVQAAIQRYTDSSISKTVNAPNNHTVDEVQRLYRLAYEMGCKGITYYRDGSRDAVLTRVEDEKKAQTQQAPVMEPITSIHQGIKPVPEMMQGYTRHVTAPEGKVNITINSDEHGPFEVFVNVGKAGSDISALAEALGRLISLNLRILSPLSQTDRAQEIADQLRGIGGSRSIGFGMQQVRSLPDAVARVLEQHMEMLKAQPEENEKSGTNSLSKTNAVPVTKNGNDNGFSNGSYDTPAAFSMSHPSVTGNLCPQCGCNTMVYEEGCRKCYSCGHSEC